MGFLAIQLDALMRDRQWNQEDLAKLSGIGQGQISQYLRSRSPTADSLTKLCEVFTRDGVLLLIAFLRDQIPPSMEGVVEIIPASSSSRVQESPPLPFVYERLPKRVRAVIDAVAIEGAKSPNLLRALEAMIPYLIHEL